MALNSARWADRLRRVLGRPIERDLAPYRSRLARIHELAAALGSRSDAELTARARRASERARAGGAAAQSESELFAIFKEAARRALGLVPYDEQLIAGLAMADGKVAEMQTGEGKTLAAVAPVALHALCGAGAHVLTFNDYLAGRDARWMGPRDAIVLDSADRVQRAFAFALVDEADSLLIDEARIPLVLATQVDRPSGNAERMTALVAGLVRGRDFETDEQERNIALTDEGAARLEHVLGCGSLYDRHNHGILVDSRNALHAQHLLHRDVDYIVRDGRVELVDDFLFVDQARARHAAVLSEEVQDRHSHRAAVVEPAIVVMRYRLRKRRHLSPVRLRIVIRIGKAEFLIGSYGSNRDRGTADSNTTPNVLGRSDGSQAVDADVRVPEATVATMEEARSKTA